MPLDSSLGIGIVIGATVGATAGRAFESTRERSARLGGALARTRKSADALRATHRRLRAEQKRSGDASGKLARDLDRVGRTLERTTRRAAAYRRELRLVGQADAARQGRDRALRTGGVALGAAYGVSRLVGREFERERTQIRLGTLLEDDAQLRRGVAHSREDVRQGRVLQDEGELLEVQYQLRGADLSAEVARVGSTLAAKIATVTKGTAADVGSVLGGVYQNFGDQIEGDAEQRLERIGEVLTRTQQKFKFSTFSDLGEGLREVAPVATNVSLSLGQTTAALGILSKAEIAGSRGGTALKAALRQLKPAADELGFSIVRDADGMLNLEATVRGLKERLDEIGDVDERFQVMQKQFGEEGVMGIAPLLAKLDGFGAAVQEIDADVQTLDEHHRRFLDAASGKAVVLRNNLGRLGGTIATVLLPAVTPVVSVVTAAAAAIGRAAEESPLLGSALRGLAGVVGTLVAVVVTFRLTRWGWVAARIGVGNFITTVKSAIKWVGGLRTSAVGLRAVQLGSALLGWGRALFGFMATTKIATAVQWAFNVALTANPIGAVVALVVAGAALIGGAVYLIWKHWEPIKAFFANILGSLADAWRPVVDAWAAVFTDFSWGKIGEAIMTTLASGIMAFGTIPLNAMKGLLGKLGDLLPFSDAREGPLSRLTASGGAILRTIGDGVRRAGPRPLAVPLRREIAAASTALALSLPVVAAVAPAGVRLGAAAAPTAAAPVQAALAPTPAAAPVQAAPAGAGVYNDHRGATFRITIVQQPGEDAAALADRLMAEIRRRDQVSRRAALHDEL